MKKITCFLFLMISYNAIQALDTGNNPAIVKAFEKRFPEAEHITWFFSNEHYVVKFQWKGILCNYRYDYKGELKESIRYYMAPFLPPFILEAVYAKYKTATIKNVTEHTIGDHTEYNIMLENGDQLLHLKADRLGFCWLYKKYKKQ